MSEKTPNAQTQAAMIEARVMARNRMPELEDSTPGFESSALRWRATGFASLRRKLDLSASEMGKLLGVTGTTINAWEAGKSKPRPTQWPAIARVRKLGKRAVAELLRTR